MTQTSRPSWAALHRLADALGVPVEQFFSDALSSEVSVSADECLRLWSEIRTEAGRQQALEALRVIATLERK